MDIIHDGFGLMLALGDLAWVPFLYCLQARFILEHPQDWSSVFLVGILALNCEFHFLFPTTVNKFHLFRIVFLKCEQKNSSSTFVVAISDA